MINLGLGKAIVTFIKSADKRTLLIENNVWDTLEGRHDIVVFSINLDFNPELAKFYNVSKLPTTFFIKNGDEKLRHQGMLTKIAVNKLIKKHLDD